MTVLQAHAGVTDCARTNSGIAEYVGAGGIQSYLEKDGRALAVDFVNVPAAEQSRWASWFDETRRMAGNDVARVRRSGPDAGRAMRCVKWHHYVISPDPRDGIGLGELRGLAVSWARRFFPDVSVAIAYHDDNAGRIPHAHLIVNNTHLGTGRRLHVSNAEAREMNRWLQAESARLGLSHFVRRAGVRGRGYENVAGARSRARARAAGRLTDVERMIAAEGRRSWKQDVREWAAVAAATCAGTVPSFLDSLSRLGVEARWDRSRGDFVFTHPGVGRMVRGSTLGPAWTQAGIEGRMAAGRASGTSAGAAWLACADVRVVHDGTGLSAGQIAEMRRAAGVGLAQVAQLLDVASSLHARSVEDLAARLEAARERLVASEGSRSELWGRRVAELEAACRTARATGIYPESRRRAREGRRRVPLSVKVERGYRLTAEEHERLKRRPEMMARWQIARQLRRADVDPSKRVGARGTAAQQGTGGAAEERRPPTRRRTR